jgi:PIN domain nuclease of toxin-antitoxin system
MRLLLDTNPLLWTLAGSSRIEPVRELLISKDTEVFASVVSLWEISTRIKSGELKCTLDDIIQGMRESSITELPLSTDHIRTLSTIEVGQLHIYDYLLVAQAINEPMHIISDNQSLAKYKVLLISV